MAQRDVLLMEPEVQPLVIHLLPCQEMDDEEFFHFCQKNSDLRIERMADGEIHIMAPAGGESGDRNSELNYQLRGWAKRDGTGKAFDSSTGFILPNRATLSPDAAWVTKTRWAKLTKEQRKKFVPLCPDFAAEIRSESDSLPQLKEKMQEYIENGARLGWLIDPRTRKVYIYRPGVAIQELDNPKTVSGDPVLPGFVLDLTDIWDLER